MKKNNGMKWFLKNNEKVEIVQSQSFSKRKTVALFVTFIFLFFCNKSVSQCTSPPGDPTIFGIGVWNTYGYFTADFHGPILQSNYAGYYATGPSFGFATDSPPAGWSNLLSPSAAPSWQGCALPNDGFTTVIKRKRFPCGTWNVVIADWSDAAKVFINGVEVFSCSSRYTPLNPCNSSRNLGKFNFDENTEIEIRLYAYSGTNRFQINIGKVNGTNPTAINGNECVNNGESVVLTANGVASPPQIRYQWGTGNTIGQNIITGETGSTITVSPTTSTTYWTRIVEDYCNNASPGVLKTITIVPTTSPINHD